MKEFPWPDGMRGAVSLTFDDALASQLDVAIPMLNDYGIRATFYVNPVDRFLERIPEWTAAQAMGHEIGNHTLSHPCSRNFAFISQGGRRALEDFTATEIEREIVEAGERLSQLLPGQAPVSFAYPCYQPYIGRGHSRESYVPIVLEHCVAGRGRGETSNDPYHCDVGYLWSFPCERMSGAEIVGLVEEAIDAGRWTILTFHGVHEGGLAVSDRDLDQVCRYLTRRREEIWTPTVAEGAVHVSAVQAAP